MALQGPRWTQFRRLLLGTVIELVRDAGVAERLDRVEIEFDARSAFEVPRFNNHMRFVGQVTIELAHDPDPTALQRLERALQGVWGDLLEVVDIPVGDRLTSTTNDTSVQVDGQRLVVRFDLVAD